MDSATKQSRRHQVAMDFLLGLSRPEEPQTLPPPSAALADSASQPQQPATPPVEWVDKRRAVATDFLSHIELKEMQKSVSEMAVVDPAMYQTPTEWSPVDVGESAVNEQLLMRRTTTPPAAAASASQEGLPVSGVPLTMKRSPIILANMNKCPLQTALVGIVDSSLIQTAMDDCRYFVSTATLVPFALFSVLRYTADESSGQHTHHHYLTHATSSTAYRRRKLHLDKLQGSMDGLKRRKGESFAHLLGPSMFGIYNPVDLDDPELKTGKHRTVISLPCYMGSMIQFTRPSELRNELNDQFKQKHPDIDPSITLSKLRNLKASLLEIALAEDVELSSLAKCYVFFEKLVLKNYVNKVNRKLIAATCMLLAVKINDKKESNYVSLLQTIEKHLYVSPKLVRDHEFAVFAALEFSLHLGIEEYMPHLERMVNMLGYNHLQEYLSGKPPPNRSAVFI